MPLALPERFEPDDFVVDEIPAYPPSGSGGHTFLHVEKRGWTTEALARVLARSAGVGSRDVGYAGRKDRHAVTTQWFSVPGFDPKLALALELDRVRVLEATPHESKLRTGHLRGNRFTVTLHEVDAADSLVVGERLDRLARDGMANRFGRQRFGQDGDNATAGLAVLRGETRPRDRREARFLLSALQSAVFNEVLRCRPLALGELELGDVAVVHPSGGLFVVEDLAREAPRAAAFEVSATGPLFGARSGRRDPAPEGAPAARELEAAASLGVDLSAPLTLPRGVRLPGARRALRVRPEEPGVEYEDGRLRLRFTLPPGSYATVLLEELCEAGAPAAP